jgi:hypothetical protein
MFPQIRLLQFAWFTPGEVAAKVEDVLLNATGLEAATMQRLKPPHAPFPMSIASAAKDGADYRVQIQPNRLDVAIVPDESVPVEAGLPYLSNADEHFANGIKAARQVCYTIGATVRQSLVVQCAIELPSEEAQGKNFAMLAGLPEKLAVGREMSLQLNLRRQLVWADQHLNRLIRLTAESAGLQKITITPQGPVAHGGRQASIRHYLSYMMDINNVPTSKSFDQAERIKLLDELLEEYKRMKSFDKMEDLL